MSKFQTVFKTSLPHQAEIVKAVLADNDIPAVIINKKDSSYHIGLIEVNVNSDDVIQALRIVEDEINFD